MQQRIFGKEITNIPAQEAHKIRRRYSLLQEQRVSRCSQATKATNKTNSISQILPIEPKNDPQMVPEYFTDNLQFLRNQEKAVQRRCNYVSGHQMVSQSSRAKLIDWLGELHQKYRMFPQTIFTVVDLIDQYLAVKDIPLKELQLVGVSAFFIAAKFEETYQVPQLRQLVTCCDGQYTARQILEKEADIIKERNFQMIVNSSYKFFDPLAEVIGLEPKNRHLAQYVLELALLQPRFLSYAPSLLASASIYLIKKIRKSETAWNETMTNSVGYKENELKVCAKDLCVLLENAPSMEHTQSIKRKFSRPEFHEVTRIKLERKEKK